MWDTTSTAMNALSAILLVMLAPLPPQVALPATLLKEKCLTEQLVNV